MRLSLVDPKVRRNWRRYLIQVSIATVALIIVFSAEQLLAGGIAARAIIVAAIASTAFILFISPFSLAARPSHTIGGHAIGILVASPMALMVDSSTGTLWLSAAPLLFSLYAAAGVGLTMFLMAATNTEHPPAAGTALAIVAHGFGWDLVAFTALSILVLVGVHQLLRRRLTDLY